jgi:protein ImuA
LWRASQLGRPRAAVFASGFAELDAALPGSGWPARALTELLLPHPGLGELRLLAPVLAGLQRQERSVLWFDPPAEPSAWALETLGIRTRLLVVVRSRVPLKGRARTLLPPAADMLWALEQALSSGQAGAVLAWLPARLRADALRRLQLAAQAHEGPAFLLREVEALQRPSVAPLRLLLASAGPDALRVQLLKRRGPPLSQAIELALPPVLAPGAAARVRRGPRSQGVAAMPAVGAAPVSAAEERAL